MSYEVGKSQSNRQENRRSNRGSHHRQRSTVTIFPDYLRVPWLTAVIDSHLNHAHNCTMFRHLVDFPRVRNLSVPDGSGIAVAVRSVHRFAVGQVTPRDPQRRYPEKAFPAISDDFPAGESQPVTHLTG